MYAVFIIILLFFIWQKRHCLPLGCYEENITDNRNGEIKQNERHQEECMLDKHGKI